MTATAKTARVWLAEVVAAAKQAQRALDEGRHQDASDSALIVCNAATAALRNIVCLNETQERTVSE